MSMHALVFTPISFSHTHADAQQTVSDIYRDLLRTSGAPSVGPRGSLLAVANSGRADTLYHSNDDDSGNESDDESGESTVNGGGHEEEEDGQHHGQTTQLTRAKVCMWG